MSALDFRALMKQERLKARARVKESAKKSNMIKKEVQKDSRDNFENCSLEDYLLTNTKEIYYVPNFLTKEEEKSLLINSYTQPKWSILAHRRLQHFGGVPHANGMIPETLPSWCESVLERLTKFGCFPSAQLPNHILLNEYTPPSGKISPHNDGPLYYPSVSI
jgi:alkylated DNA repair protein alkB family protein 6